MNFKELVCVNPQGELEVWQQYKGKWDINYNDCHAFYIPEPWEHQPPEFWGREVLSEL